MGPHRHKHRLVLRGIQPLRHISEPDLSAKIHPFGDPCGNRTRVTGVRGRCLNRLTNGPWTAFPALLDRSALRATAVQKGLHTPLWIPRWVSSATTRRLRPRIRDKVCLRHRMPSKSFHSLCGAFPFRAFYPPVTPLTFWCAIRDSNPGPAD